LRLAPARDQLSRQRDIPPGARGFHANSVRTKLAWKSRRCVREPTKELDPVLTSFAAGRRLRVPGPLPRGPRPRGPRPRGRICNARDSV